MNTPASARRPNEVFVKRMPFHLSFAHGVPVAREQAHPANRRTRTTTERPRWLGSRNNQEATVTNYQNDPNINRLNQEGYRDNQTSYTGWIIGGLVALALVIGEMLMFARDNGTTSTANNTNRPATATTAPTTTGSGATTPAPATPAAPANP